MINVLHFRELVIRRTLKDLNMWSEAAENLVLGTALQESNLTHLKQLGGGPALGLYQMEPDTHDDIWENYLDYREGEFDVRKAPAERMITDLTYATAMCRIHYWRRPERLPHAEDAYGMGRYWKQHYNSVEGAGKAEGFERHYRKYVLR